MISAAVTVSAALAYSDSATFFARISVPWGSPLPKLAVAVKFVVVFRRVILTMHGIWRSLA